MTAPADAAKPFPVTDQVLQALAVSKRGVDELLPEGDWLAKLARSNAWAAPDCREKEKGAGQTSPRLSLCNPYRA